MKSVEELANKEVELLSRRRAAMEAIAAAEQQAGEALADAEDGQDTGASTDAIGKARDAVTAIDAAINVTRERRLGAVKSKRSSEAAEVRGEAAELIKRAEVIEAKVIKHFAAVNELQETQFLQPLVAPLGDLPLTLKLHQQAQALVAKAGRLDADLPTSGEVDIDGATSVDDLIAAVLRFEGPVPAVQSILDWAAACEVGHQFSDLPRRYRLMWKDGKIDRAASYTFVSALVPLVLPVTYDFAPRLDAAGGHFRAE